MAESSRVVVDSSSNSREEAESSTRASVVGPSMEGMLDVVGEETGRSLMASISCRRQYQTSASSEFETHRIIVVKASRS